MIPDYLQPNPSDNFFVRNLKRFLLWEHEHWVQKWLLPLVLGIAASMALDVIRPAVGRWMAPVLAAYWGRLLLEVVFIVVSVSLFALKLKRQKLYGFLECVFAIAASWTIVSRLQGQLFAQDAIGLVAAGYILVRGMSNYRDGQQKPSGTIPG